MLYFSLLAILSTVQAGFINLTELEDNDLTRILKSRRYDRNAYPRQDAGKRAGGETDRGCWNSLYGSVDW